MLLRWVCDKFSGIDKIALALDDKQLPFKAEENANFHTGL